MNIKKNKKAVEINIATIIILVLAILVLVVLALYFTGGMKSLWDMIIGKKVAYTTSALDDAKNKCENIFTIQQFCTEPVDVYNTATKQSDYICCFNLNTNVKPRYSYTYTDTDGTQKTTFISTATNCNTYNIPTTDNPICGPDKEKKSTTP